MDVGEIFAIIWTVCIVGIFIIVFGYLNLAGIIALIRYKSLNTAGSATIVDVQSRRRHRKKRRRTEYNYTYRYYTNQGTISKESGWVESKFQVGDNIPLRYSKSDPDKVMLKIKVTKAVRISILIFIWEILAIGIVLYSMYKA